MLALGDGPIREDKFLNEIKIMATNRVAHINRTTTDGPGSSVELCGAMIRLKHVPVWLYDLTHPQAVVCTVDHVDAL